MKNWQLADAKNRFSELVTLAVTEGPQVVHRRKDTVVVLSERDYKRLSGKAASFKDYLVKGPSFKGLDLNRDKSSPRDVRL
jgi:prevent-host-death family protein